MNTTGKKFGGRKKGTPNKVTKEIRDIIKEFIYENISDIQANYDKLESREKIHYFIKLLDYAIPKLKMIEQRNVVYTESEIENLTDEQINAEIKRLSKYSQSDWTDNPVVVKVNNETTKENIESLINDLES